MTDRYERIRAALVMGPTPGPWYWIGDSLTHRQFNIYAINGTDKHIATVNDLSVEKLWARDQVESEATAKLIAACDPDTIRELIAERDVLAAEVERLTEALRGLEEREQHNEVLLRQALDRLEAVVERFDPYIGDNECRPMENARSTIAVLRERLGEGDPR